MERVYISNVNFDEIIKKLANNATVSIVLTTGSETRSGKIVNFIPGEYIDASIDNIQYRYVWSMIDHINVWGCNCWDDIKKCEKTSLNDLLTKMSPERFQELLDELDGNSLQTLKEKNARYSQDGDSLHNFRSGAEIAGGTPAQACWGYMTKHLVALRDMVEKDDFSNREDFLEKCQDTINYIRFLWCIGNENNNKEKE